MANFEIRGIFYDCPTNTAESILRFFFGNIQIKNSILENHLFFESNVLTFHLETTNNGKKWYLNADFTGLTTDFKQLLDRLSEKLIEVDILYLIDTIEVNENGEPVSEEETLSHPEFDKRYKLR